MAAQDAHGRKSSWAKAPVAPVRLRRGPCYIVIPSTVGVLRGILSVSYLQGKSHIKCQVVDGHIRKVSETGSDSLFQPASSWWGLGNLPKDS